MDTSELFEQLQHRIEETSRDRERLSEAVRALDHEIIKLEMDQANLQRLVSRFDKTRKPPRGNAADAATRKAASEQSKTGGMLVTWPAGPGEEKPIKTKKARAWARYKLVAATWYLNTLSEIAGQHGLSERVIGVEMAVEGTIHALCSSFDAATYALTRTIESVANIPPDRRTPSHLANWSKLMATAKFLGIDLTSSLSIADALLGEHSESPQGWLAQLQVLGNRSLREDLIVTQKLGKRGPQDLLIKVPFQGPQPILDYLSRSRELISELLETIFYDVASVRKEVRAKMATGQPRIRAEQGLESLLPDATS